MEQLSAIQSKHLFRANQPLNTGLVTMQNQCHIQHNTNSSKLTGFFSIAGQQNSLGSIALEKRDILSWSEGNNMLVAVPEAQLVNTESLVQFNTSKPSLEVIHVWLKKDSSWLN